MPGQDHALSITNEDSLISRDRPRGGQGRGPRRQWRGGVIAPFTERRKKLGKGTEAGAVVDSPQAGTGAVHKRGKERSRNWTVPVQYLYVRKKVHEKATLSTTNMLTLWTEGNNVDTI